MSSSCSRWPSCWAIDGNQQSVSCRGFAATKRVCQLSLERADDVRTHARLRVPLWTRGFAAQVCRRRTAAAIGAVQRRSDGAARQEPRRCAPAGAGSRCRPPAGTPCRERRHPGRGVRPADGGGVRQSPHFARRGMAARQFLSDRGADSHGQAALAQRVQPRTPPPGARAVRLAAASLRPRVRGDLSWRRQGRRGKFRPVRGGLSGRDAAQDGRAVGHSHHAAAGADRKSAPRRKPDCQRDGRPQSGRGVGGRNDGRRPA